MIIVFGLFLDETCRYFYFYFRYWIRCSTLILRINCLLFNMFCSHIYLVFYNFYSYICI